MAKYPKHLEDRDKKGAREYSPSAARNIPPLLEALSPLWPDNAKILEIASGTGEHAVAFCRARADIFWQMSDYDAQARASQNEWRLEVPDQIQTSFEIDVLKAEWWAELSSYDAIFCSNMIHIAPSASIEGLAKGSAQLLRAGGYFYLYGPFQEGAETAPSNLAFDKNLKQRNPDWGVRNLSSVKHIFASHGLIFQERIVMPKENRLLVFKRSI